MVHRKRRRRIAQKAGANKRMLYYHVGNKEDLYLAVLEGAYEKIRAEERELDLEHLAPPEAIERLIPLARAITEETLAPLTAKETATFLRLLAKLA